MQKTIRLQSKQIACLVCTESTFLNWIFNCRRFLRRAFDLCFCFLHCHCTLDDTSVMAEGLLSSNALSKRATAGGAEQEVLKLSLKDTLEHSVYWSCSEICRSAGIHALSSARSARRTASPAQQDWKSPGMLSAKWWAGLRRVEPPHTVKSGGLAGTAVRPR